MSGYDASLDNSLNRHVERAVVDRTLEGIATVSEIGQAVAAHLIPWRHALFPVVKSTVDRATIRAVMSV